MDMKVVPLRQREDTLEEAAAWINRQIDLFRRASASFMTHRVRAGILLRAVRPRVEKAGLGWEAWCADNIALSMREIQRVMKIAGADDQEAALEEERAKSRNSMAATRAKATNVGRLFSQFLKLDAEQRIEFYSLVKKEMET